MRSYSPAEFLSGLTRDELDDPNEVRIIGLARSDDADPSVIRFSYSLRCETWLSIPVALVESVDHLKTVPCKAHEHPLVRITFKAPAADRGDLGFFLGLVSEMQNRIAYTTRAARAVRAGRAVKRLAASPMAGAPCWVEEGPVGLEVCCYDDVNPDIACTGMV